MFQIIWHCSENSSFFFHLTEYMNDTWKPKNSVFFYHIGIHFSKTLIMWKQALKFAEAGKSCFIEIKTCILTLWPLLVIFRTPCSNGGYCRSIERDCNPPNVVRAGIQWWINHSLHCPISSSYIRRSCTNNQQ